MLGNLLDVRPERSHEVGFVHGAGAVVLPLAHEPFRSRGLDDEEKVVVGVGLITHDNCKHLEAMGLMVDAGKSIELLLKLVEGRAASIPRDAGGLLINKLIHLA
jgi:hypothetical protein